MERNGDAEEAIRPRGPVLWRWAAAVLAVAIGACARARRGRRQRALRVVGLRTEYKENPLGIDARKPRLSWQLVVRGRGVRQSAYEIRVARSDAASGR